MTGSHASLSWQGAAAFAKLKRTIRWPAPAPHDSVPKRWLCSHTTPRSVWRQLSRCILNDPRHAGNWLCSTCLGTP